MKNPGKLHKRLFVNIYINFITVAEFKKYPKAQGNKKLSKFGPNATSSKKPLDFSKQLKLLTFVNNTIKNNKILLLKIKHPWFI